MACFLDCGQFFCELPVMAHKRAAPAGGEIRTGQSGVTTVHLKTCQTEKHRTFDLASPEVGAKGVEERQFADTQFFFPPQLT